jgi:peptidoglycan/xylan/chitin deacetylase (PgdA/CDA1 family)
MPARAVRHWKEFGLLRKRRIGNISSLGGGVDRCRSVTGTVPNAALPRRGALTQPLRKAVGELFFLFARLRGYSAPRFPILAYHSVSDEPGSDIETVRPVDFECQMSWLAARGFEAVTVSDLIAVITRPSPRRRVVAITFDDGYRDNLVTALPILRRHGFRATFYISSAYIGGLSRWNPVEYIGHRPMLGNSEIRALSAAGHEIGSHAHSHVDLTSVDPARVEEELERSRRVLADITGEPVVAFAPPYGRLNGMVAERARRLGYSHLVRGGRFTANPKGAAPYDLQRITIARGDSLREFAKKVSGAYQWLTFRDR